MRTLIIFQLNKAAAKMILDRLLIGDIIYQKIEFHGTGNLCEVEILFNNPFHEFLFANFIPTVKKICNNLKTK